MHFKVSTIMPGLVDETTYNAIKQDTLSKFKNIIDQAIFKLGTDIAFNINIYPEEIPGSVPPAERMIYDLEVIRGKFCNAKH